MVSRKLIVTHRGRLVEKYGASGAQAVDDAVAALIAADAERGLRTDYVHLDVADEVKPFGAKPVSKTPSASQCKTAIDQIFKGRSSDYLVLLGSDDVIPHFRVPNPAYTSPNGDTDEFVPTDNPYAASTRFTSSSRASYLIPDRVTGRIPDLPGAKDPKVLLNYLDAAATAKPSGVDAFALDLLISCDFWKDSGSACVAALGRNKADLFLSGPTQHDTGLFADRHKALLHLIRCHGFALDPRFYGEDSLETPEVLSTSSLTGRITAGTVIGATCCYGAAIYNPDDEGALQPGVPGIATTYLDQRAAGFVGSTTITYLEAVDLTCADVIVTRYLKNVMAGDSLGRALLNAKQQFATDISGAGKNPKITEEKTLLQFILLGDPSLRPILPSEMRRTADTLPEAAKGWLSLSSAERRSRRDYHYRRARELRQAVPNRHITEPRLRAADILQDEELAQCGATPTIVHRLTRKKPQPESSEPASPGETTAAEKLGVETLQYYWFLRTPREKIIDIKVVMVETDLQNNILRKQVSVSS
jgi:hypothetical protein